jgi:hypothetical protein
LATLPHRLLQVAMQWPARRSQGCEVARVLNFLDTTGNTGFPYLPIDNQMASVFFPPIFHFPSSPFPFSPL